MHSPVPKLLTEYQEYRMKFAQNLAKLASERKNIEAFRNTDVMSILRPLLVDRVRSIQLSAVQTLGHLINYSESFAETEVLEQILPLLVNFLAEDQLALKKAAAFALRAVMKYSPNRTQEVVNSGVLEPMLICLELENTDLKKIAISALDLMVKHSIMVETLVEQTSFLPLLVISLRDPDASLKSTALSSLGNVAKHSAALAEKVVDAGALPFMSQLITHSDSEVKRQVCYALAQVAQHTVALAQLVMDLEVLPKTLNCLKDADLHVRENAATCIMQLSKQTSSIAELITNSGGAVAMVDYVTAAKGKAKLPGIWALGYFSAFTAELAMKVITSKAIPLLSSALTKEPDDEIKVVAAWTLGQMGRHSENHAKLLFDANVPAQLLAAHTSESSSDDLKQKAKKALKSIIQMCPQLGALQPLLGKSPPMILKYLLKKYSTMLPCNVEALQDFEQRGGLRRAQEIAAPAESKLHSYIETIKGLYPSEVVQRNAPQGSSS